MFLCVSLENSNSLKKREVTRTLSLEPRLIEVKPILQALSSKELGKPLYLSEYVCKMGVTQLSREVHIFLHPSIHLFIHLPSKIKCLQWLVSEVSTAWSNEGRSVRTSSSVEHTINYWPFSLSKVSFLSSFPSNAPSHILLPLDLCASHGILSNKKLSFGISHFMLSSSFFFLLQTPCFFEKPLCHRSRVPW